MKNFYIYIYTDPRKPGKFIYEGVDICFLFEPFYIGKGTKNRYKVHIQSSYITIDTNYLKQNTLKK